MRGTLPKYFKTRLQCNLYILLTGTFTWEVHFKTNEPPSEKTGLRGFRPGLTQTGLYSH